MILLDESGFSLTPIRGTTWAPIGKPTVIRETYSRESQTGLGLITMTPVRQKLNFRFSIFSGAINTEDVIFFLTMIHRYYGTQVMIIWDRLPAHVSAHRHFDREHPHWFFFEYFPACSPELNPVEQCWNVMKNVYIANYVPMCIDDLHAKCYEAAELVNADPKRLESFFHHAKLRL